MSKTIFKMRTMVKTVAILAVSTMMFASCEPTEDDPTPDPGTEQDANFVAFTFEGIDGAAEIDKDELTVTAQAQETVDLADITAEFTLSTGATATVDGTPQVSGTTANDFNDPVTYTVTSGDGETTLDWTVTITKEGGNIEPTVWTKVENTGFSDVVVNGIAYGNNKFVAVGNKAQMTHSTDGINWTAITNTTFGEGWTNQHNTHIYAIAYGGDKFVAVGAGNQMAHSTDGISWTKVGNTAFIYAGMPGIELEYQTKIRSITYGNGKFVAGGCEYDYYDGDEDEHTGAHIAYSADGVNWTAVDVKDVLGRGNGGYGTIYVSAITYGNGKFVAGTRSGSLAYSTDGINWTAAASSPFVTMEGNTTIPYGVFGIAYGNGKYIAVGQHEKMASSADGITWTEMTGNANPFNSDIENDIVEIRYVNGKFIATAGRNQMAYSTDGTNWTDVDISHLFGSGGASDLIEDVTYGAGKLVAVGRSAAGGTQPIIAYSNE